MQSPEDTVTATPPSTRPALTALSQLVGNTPVLRVGEPFASEGRGFWAKLEGFNPGGIKDRPGLHMVERARTRGDLRPGGRIIESTSGTLGLGLALAGMVHGHPVTLVTDPGMEASMTRLLNAYGAQVNVVSEPHPTGGWQQARRDRVTQLLSRHPESWCPDQYNNPDNTTAYAPLALELADELGHIDVLVCSVGTGGHSAGVSRVLRQRYPQLRLVGVDTVGSTIFGQPARPRLMRGLGSSIYPRNVAYGSFSEVHWVAPAEAVWACRRLAASHYATGGWSVGAVAARRRMARPDPARGHTDRCRLPRRAAALSGHRLRRRLLPGPRPARRAARPRTGRDRLRRREGGHPLDPVRRRGRPAHPLPRRQCGNGPAGRVLRHRHRRR